MCCWVVLRLAPTQNQPGSNFMRRTYRLRVFLLVVTAAIVSACGSSTDSDSPVPSAKAPASTTIGKSLNATAAPGGITVEKIDRRLQGASGPVDVWVSMDTPSLAAQKSALAASAGVEKAKELSTSSSKAAVAQSMEKARSALFSQQSKVALSLASAGAEELARVHVAHNAIAIRVDASQLSQIALIPGVAAVRQVVNYEMDLSETVPYVGGTAVQASGNDGAGVTVAVLDSGIDYTHRNLGGDGTPEAYAAAYGASPSDPLNTTLDGLFPTPKVVGGFDFVGEAWPDGDRTDDPDPIDFQGHGTHVADIVGGRSNDGTHVG